MNDGDNENAMIHANSAFELAKKFDLPTELIKANGMIELIFISLGNYNKNSTYFINASCFKNSVEIISYNKDLIIK